MKYEDMNFKVPVESKSYKEDSEFVIEQITQILDRQRQREIIELLLTQILEWDCH